MKFKDCQSLPGHRRAVDSGIKILFLSSSLLISSQAQYNPAKAQPLAQPKSSAEARFNALQHQLETVSREMKTLTSGLNPNKKSMETPRAGDRAAKTQMGPQEQQAKQNSNEKLVERRAAKQSPPKKTSEVSQQRGRYDKAYAAFLKGDYERAEKLFREFLRSSDPGEDTRRANLWLAEIYMSRGNRNKALRFYKKSAPSSARKVSARKANVAEAPTMNAEPPQWMRRPIKTLNSGIKPRAQDEGGNARNSIALGSVDDFITSVGDSIFFESGQAGLTEQAQKLLSKQAAWLIKHETGQLTLEGHSDGRGSREQNLQMGAKRAKAVKAFLVAKGVESARIRTVSYGKERPIALCESVACLAQNRRVIIRVTQAPDFIAEGRKERGNYKVEDEFEEINDDRFTLSSAVADEVTEEGSLTGW